MKILLIRFSSIGDIVLTTSPLATLRKAFPTVKIHFLTLEPFVPLLEGQPNIDQIISLEKSAKYRQLTIVGNFLNDAEYDLVIDLHNTLRSQIIRRRIRSTVVRVLKKPRWLRFKLFWLHLNHFPDCFSQRWLLHQPLKDLVDDWSQLPQTELKVSTIEQQQAADYLRACGVSGDYLVLVPGAAWKQKIWRLDYYRALIKQLEEADLGDIVVVGGAKDTICDSLAATIPELINLRGKTDLRMAMAILSRAKLVIGSDTGLVHAAEALGVRVAMILGPTSRETGGGANLPVSKTYEVSDLWCRPCSQNGKNPCYRKEQFCMTLLKPDLVWNDLRRQFAV
ncbi:MAG: glycosyltransferase family 9 protein [FCB group bacterium]|nr:glycosyltransferase family 9 protein [FCB group bacterium]